MLAISPGAREESATLGMMLDGWQIAALFHGDRSFVTLYRMDLS
jgi:hypothetical protein